MKKARHTGYMVLLSCVSWANCFSFLSLSFLVCHIRVISGPMLSGLSEIGGLSHMLGKPEALSVALLITFPSYFHPHLLSTYCVPGTALGTKDTALTTGQNILSLLAAFPVIILVPWLLLLQKHQLEFQGTPILSPRREGTEFQLTASPLRTQVFHDEMDVRAFSLHQVAGR